MFRSLATAAGFLLALAASSPAQAQTTGTYEGDLIVTALTGDSCTSDNDGSVGDIHVVRLNNSSSDSLNFAAYSADNANAFSIPESTPGTLPASGTLTSNSIGGNATLKSPQSLAYAEAALTVTDATNNVISFTIQITMEDTCEITLAGSLMLLTNSSDSD